VNADEWRRLAPLVDEALGREGDERRAYLDGLGARDPALRREVEAFLAEESSTRGLFEAPVERHAATLFDSFAEEDSWDALAVAGTTVGAYRVLGELGQGGMGAVFLAERSDGQFDQRVALKLVRRGLAVDEVLARFRAERQILARLQHPHIARLLDGGVTADGQPYFAMELVEGTPLTAHCDRARLRLDARLRLFLQVCDAVEYAHRNLVVHRDLKPSNILVTAGGQAKLLDFGIAKVLSPEMGEHLTTVTLRGARPFTPEYAAPEQVLGRVVTTVTDVYSLGILLYELVSGRSPYRSEGLGRAEVQQLVVSGPAEPPSAAVFRTAARDAPADVAGARGLSPDRLARTLRGDLDNVAAMALRVEPHRRYASVGALADDVRRFLEGRPVSARPDTFAYRASKFVRRRKLAVAAAGVVAASVAAGLAGTLWQAREAVRQARTAEQVKRFALGLFEVADPDVAKGREMTARELLDRAVPRIRTELAGQPEIEAEMLLFVGNIEHHLGLHGEARPLFERALELRRARPGDELGVAEAEVALAAVAFSDGRIEDAEVLMSRAFERRRRRLGPAHAETAVAQGLLGRIRFERGDIAAAGTLLDEAVALQRRRGPEVQAELAANVTTLGRVRQRRGDLPGAEALYREALDIRRRLHGEEHSGVAEALFNLATLMRERGDLAGAEAQYRALLVRDRKLLGPESEAVGLDLNSLGATLVSRGACEEAEGLLRESVRVFAPAGRAEGAQLHLPLYNLARALRCRGRAAEAEAIGRDALARARALLGDAHVSTAAVRCELARILGARGAHAEARALASEAVSALRPQLAADHLRLADALLAQGQVELAAGRPAEAESRLREAVGALTRRFGERDWRTGEARLVLAEDLAALGRWAEARAEWDGAGLGLAGLGPEHPLGRAHRALTLSAAR
jgi:serine/threonine-protein kinase